MKWNRRTNTIILWAISIGLLVGMVLTFTPSLGLFGGPSANAQGTPQLTVNGETIYEADVLRMRQNSLFTVVTEGQVADDLQRLLVDELVRQKVLTQAAARMNVSNGDVSAAVNEFRTSRGVDGRGNDQAYLQLIGSAGFNDQSFRDYIREQLRVEAWEERLTGDVSVTDAEVEAYYLSHPSAYQSEERIEARQIVVDDLELAQSLRQQVVDGASFADLAAEHSLELADRQGALGAAAGETTPRPVGRPALPTAVANAAFALRGRGLTEVVESNQRYYLVQVDAYLPADTLPFADVEERVRTDVTEAKRAGIVEAELERLRREAVIAFPETSVLTFDDPPVATVGDETITASELDRATYTNPQIQQALSPQTADLIVGLFKPAVLSQLIDTELAFQGARQLDVELVGTRSGVAQAALNYVARDVEADEDEIALYYEDNRDSFVVPAEAQVTAYRFADAADAAAFRSALLAGSNFEDAAQAQGAEVEDFGRVQPGRLDTAYDTAVFETEAWEALPDGVLEVGDVLVVQEALPVVDGEDAAGAEAVADEAVDEAVGEATDETTAEDAAETAADAEAAAEADTGADTAADTETDTEAGAETDIEAGADGDQQPQTRDVYVVLVAERTPERVRPLDDVRSQVEAAVLAQERQDVRFAWLDELRESIEVAELTTVDAAPEFELVPEATDGGEGEAAAGDAETGDAAAGDAESVDGEAGDADAGDAGADDAVDDDADTEPETGN